MKKIISVVVLAILVVTGACARNRSMGTKIDQNTIAMIKQGETTKEQVLTQLGPPNQAHNRNGLETYVYTYFNTEISGKSFIPVAGVFMGGHTSEHQFVAIEFDDKGVVKSVSTSQGRSDSYRGW